MDEEQFKEIASKIDLIIRLLALNIVKDMKFQTDKIIALSSFGFSPSEIARLLGKTPNIVTAVLSDVKKKTRKVEEPSKTNQGESKPSQEAGKAKVGETIV